MTQIHDRIGVDIGARFSVSEAVSWAATNDVNYIDVRLGDTLTDELSEATIENIRETCATHDIHLGLHTLSAVNMAATAPFVREAADEYIMAYLRAADRLGAGWVVVHGGYHFTADRDERICAGLDRLERAVWHAEELGIDLLLENHNPEPADGEIHYLPVTTDECERYFNALSSDRLRWAFTINHAHMLPAGINGFLDDLDVDRCGEVRIADNRGEKEEHLQPGKGTIDFEALFERLEHDGYQGHYMLAFNDLEDMLAGREYIGDLAHS